MKSLLMLLLISSLLVLQTNTTNALQDSKEEKMKKLIEDIIKSPTRMIQIMKNNQTIDCTDIVDLLEDDSRLIEFTLDIAYLKCKNYRYDGIEESPVFGSDEKSFYIYYIKGEGIKREDFISFKFRTEGDKIIFKGIPKSID